MIASSPEGAAPLPPNPIVLPVGELSLGMARANVAPGVLPPSISNLARTVLESHFDGVSASVKDTFAALKEKGVTMTDNLDLRKHVAAMRARKAG